MPDRQTHLDAAIAVGVLAALLASKADTPWALLAEIGGTIAGSVLGGILPDVLEPGTSSWHRKSFHSVTALSGTAGLAVSPPEEITAFRKRLRQRAATLRAQRETLPPGHAKRTDFWLAEMGCHVVAGASVGLPVGYVSHLLLDGRSPRGLPTI